MATTTEVRWLRRRRGVLATAIAATGLILAGCGDDGGGSDPIDGEQVYPGELHDCAGAWPVPEDVTVLETARRGEVSGAATCVVSLETGLPVREATAALLLALDADGWDHEVQQHEEEAAMVELHGPLCGVMLVLPEGASTSVLVSLIDCDRMADRPPLPGPEVP